MPKTTTQITQAREAEPIAADLISKHHPHLTGATILYLFTDGKRSKHGKTVLGTAQKANPLQRYLSTLFKDDGADFIILLSLKQWETLDAKERVALVDHELMHCGLKIAEDEDEENEWVLLPHDFEGFAAEIERHGLWHQDAKDIGAAVRQLAFEGMRERVPAGAR